MPRRSRYRKKKSGRKSRRSNQMVIRKSPMPLKFATKLRYVENFTINPGAAGTTGTYVMDAGSVYDPNVTSTGHQPRGFDQLMAMYDHFVVIGSKCTATITINASDNNNQICGLALRDGPTVDTDPNDYLEGGTVRSGHLTNERKTRVFTLGYSPKRFLGRSKPLADPDLKGSTSSNPTESAYYHIFSAGLNATDPSALDVTVVIDYLVVFIEPKDVAQS